MRRLQQAGAFDGRGGIRDEGNGREAGAVWHAHMGPKQRSGSFTRVNLITEPATIPASSRPVTTQTVKDSSLASLSEQYSTA